MYKKGVCKGEDKLLPAVSEKEALDQFLGFCQKHDTDAIVYHGEDHRTLKPWLQRFGICTNIHDSGTPSPTRESCIRIWKKLFTKIFQKKINFPENN